MTIVPGTSVRKAGIVLNDPELRYSLTGIAICTFTLRENVDNNYHVVCFGEMAEKIMKEDGYNIRKGSSITIWGYFKIRTWKDRDGKERQRPELRIRKIEVY